MPVNDQSLFDRIIELALPPGGCAVIFAEAYVDESGTHQGSPILTVAGYLFKREQARRFSRDWRKDLARLGLPAAHQSDCANGRGAYADMDMADRIKSECLLIENIKRRTVFGFGISVDPEMYADIVLAGGKNAPSAYTFALQGCFTIIRRWAARTEFDGKISYFFESGHRSQREASRYISEALLKSDESKAKHRYTSHSFVEKDAAPELQAADMLAWQFQHHRARQKIGIDAPRKDFLALIRPQDMSIDHNEESLRRFRRDIIDKGWMIDRY